MKILILIFTILSFSLSLSGEKIDIDGLIEKIEEVWHTINDYTCTVMSYTKKGNKEERSITEQKFLKPKWIHMKIIDGNGKGSVGIYNPITKKVKGYKSGLFKFIVLTLDITDKRVASLRGQRIDQGDCGTLIERLIEYNKQNEFTAVTKTLHLEKPAYLFFAETKDTIKLWGAKKEHIFIDLKNFLPLRIEQLTGSGEIVHYSIYKDIKINIGLSEEDFKP